jgi:hypothetical protein
MLIRIQKKPPPLLGRAKKGATGGWARPVPSTTDKQSEFDVAFNAIMGG